MLPCYHAALNPFSHKTETQSTAQSNLSMFSFIFLQKQNSRSQNVTTRKKEKRTARYANTAQFRSKYYLANGAENKRKRQEKREGGLVHDFDTAEIDSDHGFCVSWTREGASFCDYFVWDHVSIAAL
jgi:hypothetical protein